VAWGVLILALIVALVWIASPRSSRSPVRDVSGEFPSVQFLPEPLLVNNAERAAWGFLGQADLGQAHVFAKVRMEDFVSVRGPERRRFAARGHIKSRHIDFLLTDAEFRPLMAVEVDGGSHHSEKAVAADELKNRILYLAGVPLLRLRVGTDWNEALAEWKESRSRQ